MMRIRSAILIAACRSHAWVGAHLLQAQEPGGFDEVTLELAAAGVREVRSVFPDLASMPVPVVEWLAGGGGVTLVVDASTPPRLAQQAQDQLAGHRVSRIRIVSEPGPAGVVTRLLPSGAVEVPARSEAADLLDTAAPLLRAVLPERKARIQVQDDVPARTVLSNTVRLIELGAKDVVVKS